MTNLIGDDILDYEQWLTVPGATVHLYGRARRGRAARWPCHRSGPGKQEIARLPCPRRARLQIRPSSRPSTMPPGSR